MRVARANVSFLPPGPWLVLTDAQWDSICKWAKVKDKNTWTKAGIEALTIGDNTPIETYRFIFPDLYEMLKGEVS